MILLRPESLAIDFKIAFVPSLHSSARKLDWKNLGGLEENANDFCQSAKLLDSKV